MTLSTQTLPEVLRHSPVRVCFGPGQLAQLGELARVYGATHVFLVSDPGIVAAGYVDQALVHLHKAGLTVTLFDGARKNPTTEHVAAGVETARGIGVDLIVGLGGGSAMDCAKGINLILTNGGQIADYWGENRTTAPLLPMIAIPTTAGTGSEAQSFALITDPVTHRKMACGDRRLPKEGGLRPVGKILDSDLTRTQPPHVAAAAGMDAIAHAVETAATTRRTDTSLALTLEAWRLLEPAIEQALRNPEDDAARQQMLLGAHLAGAAIEQSMLGAAHACANPLTARFGIVHGEAVGLMLPHVIRFNAGQIDNPYAPLCNHPETLTARVTELLHASKLAISLADCGVTAGDIDDLAAGAALQWTGQFNPRPLQVTDFAELYRRAL